MLRTDPSRFDEILATTGGAICSVTAPSPSPASGAKAAMYTNPTTLGRSPASVITAPPIRMADEQHGPIDLLDHLLSPARIVGQRG